MAFFVFSVVHSMPFVPYIMTNESNSARGPPPPPLCLSTVAGRILPNDAKRGRPSSTTRPPTVIMKMDIEGSEVEVLTDLLLSGAMAHIDATMVEFHTRLARDKVSAHWYFPHNLLF